MNRLNARNKYGIGVMERIARETGGVDFDGQGKGLLKGFHDIDEQLRSSFELAYHPRATPRARSPFTKSPSNPSSPASPSAPSPATTPANTPGTQPAKSPMRPSTYTNHSSPCFSLRLCELCARTSTLPTTSRQQRSRRSPPSAVWHHANLGQYLHAACGGSPLTFGSPARLLRAGPASTPWRCVGHIHSSIHRESARDQRSSPAGPHSHYGQHWPHRSQPAIRECDNP